MARVGSVPGAGRSVGPGPLRGPDALGLRLPEGFRGRVVAVSGAEPVPGCGYRWHHAPDGGACFPRRAGGWVYVSNSELPAPHGGVGVLAFGPDGRLLDAYPILRGSDNNCAGGATPWGAWLSCEEHDRGIVWECDPDGLAAAMARPALGVFAHEAAAWAGGERAIYLSEDQPDGCLYRFLPRRFDAARADLAEGVLQVAVAASGDPPRLRWHELPDPAARRVPTRHQVAGAMRFDGGEGLVAMGGRVFLATKGDNRIWAYDLADGRLRVIYDLYTSPNPILRGVDNLAALGERLLVAEDGGDMQIVLLGADGAAHPLLQVVGQRRSEITGPALSPAGDRLYFSSQRGAGGRSSQGLTYEVVGPFAAL